MRPQIFLRSCSSTRGQAAGPHGGWCGGIERGIKVTPPSPCHKPRYTLVQGDEACPDKWLHSSCCKCSQTSKSLLLLLQLLQACQGNAILASAGCGPAHPPAHSLAHFSFSFLFLRPCPSTLFSLSTDQLTNAAAKPGRAMTSDLSLLLRAPPRVTPFTT